MRTHQTYSKVMLSGERPLVSRDAGWLMFSVPGWGEGIAPRLTRGKGPVRFAVHSDQWKLNSNLCKYLTHDR